jgi:hypothetical protein
VRSGSAENFPLDTKMIAEVADLTATTNSSGR